LYALCTGNPAQSPHPNSELPTGFPPTPLTSIEVKREPGKMISPTGMPNDPSAQIGSIPSLPGSGNDIHSPTFTPSSITSSQQSHQIKTEPNTGIDSIPLDNLPSVPAVPTPTGQYRTYYETWLWIEIYMCMYILTYCIVCSQVYQV